MSQPGKQKNNYRPVIGITLGDINGIGAEVIIKALSDARILNMITPVIYGSVKVLSYYRKMLENNDFNFGHIKNLDQINRKRINVINCWTEIVEINAGTEDRETGKYAFMALKDAVKDLKAGKIDALVTGPINKNTIQSDEFKFPGHTEYLAGEIGKGKSLMTMVSATMKIGVATGHIPLKDVNKAITSELIEEKLRIFQESLKKDFNILKPRIAVLGLNPHAGEAGLLGDEEEKVIMPAIAEFKKKGNLVYGPFPADGFFGDGSYARYDGILAMYHDQGLVPFKALSFETGVNFTAGLSKIRTSPDHGTAYSIAGKGTASEASMREAIYLAADICKNHERNKAELEV